jgi:hypothetical protein
MTELEYLPHFVTRFIPIPVDAADPEGDPWAAVGWLVLRMSWYQGLLNYGLMYGDGVERRALFEIGTDIINLSTAAMTIGQGRAAEITIRHQGNPRDGDVELLRRILAFIALLPERQRGLVANATAELALK